tara:strand:+ start:183 stop:554 length:372 start_codon:yes stop_codon:yes gene_type:complete
MAPQLHIEKKFHNGLEDVLRDIIETGFWPSTYVSSPTPPPGYHWHQIEAHGYCMSGNTWIGCGETGEKYTIEQGDKLILPPGALHIEGESDGPVTYVIALPDTRRHAEAFQLMPPDHPDRPVA